MTEKWDKRYMKMAKLISTWSKDPSTKVGAILVGEKGQIISTGYNGFARGIDDSEERYNNRELKYKYIVHGEMNCVFNAIHSNADPRNSTLYVYGLPICHDCAKSIIQVGIKRIVICKIKDTWKESCDLAFSMFDEVGIKYEFIEI